MAIVDGADLVVHRLHLRMPNLPSTRWRPDVAIRGRPYASKDLAGYVEIHTVCSRGSSERSVRRGAPRADPDGAGGGATRPACPPCCCPLRLQRPRSPKTVDFHVSGG